ncbi:hypothetical protein [Kitasatospora sp. NPDC059673]|uniref:hypothetical protein n=1 Tax=Kitasatospora sp. NPDC059673 TaxID=3346901 RepID=UPI0036938DDA
MSSPADPSGPGGPEDAHRAEQDALRGRISADPLTTRRDYLRIVATVSGGWWSAPPSSPRACCIATATASRPR